MNVAQKTTNLTQMFVLNYAPQGVFQKNKQKNPFLANTKTPN